MHSQASNCISDWKSAPSVDKSSLFLFPSLSLSLFLSLSLSRSLSLFLSCSVSPFIPSLYSLASPGSNNPSVYVWWHWQACCFVYEKYFLYQKMIRECVCIQGIHEWGYFFTETLNWQEMSCLNTKEYLVYVVHSVSISRQSRGWPDMPTCLETFVIKLRPH